MQIQLTIQETKTTEIEIEVNLQELHLDADASQEEIEESTKDLLNNKEFLEKYSDRENTISTFEIIDVKSI